MPTVEGKFKVIEGGEKQRTHLEEMRWRRDKKMAVEQVMGLMGTKAIDTDKRWS
jgi:hypothetical protein